MEIEYIIVNSVLLLLLFTFEKIPKQMQMSQWSQFSPEDKVINFALFIPLIKPRSLTALAPLFCAVLSYKVFPCSSLGL